MPTAAQIATIQKLIDKGVPPEDIQTVVDHFKQQATVSPVPSTEGTTFMTRPRTMPGFLGQGTFQGALEGVVGGLRGIPHLPAATAMAIPEGVMGLISGSADALKGLYHFVTDTGKTVEETKAAFAKLPETTQKMIQSAADLAATDPEAFSRATMDLTGGALVAAVTAKVIPMMPKPIAAKIGASLARVGKAGEFAAYLTGAHQIAQGDPRGILTLGVPAAMRAASGPLIRFGMNPAETAVADQIAMRPQVKPQALHAIEGSLPPVEGPVRASSPPQGVAPPRFNDLSVQQQMDQLPVTGPAPLPSPRGPMPPHQVGPSPVTPLAGDIGVTGNTTPPATRFPYVRPPEQVPTDISTQVTQHLAEQTGAPPLAAQPGARAPIVGAPEQIPTDVSALVSPSAAPTGATPLMQDRLAGITGQPPTRLPVAQTGPEPPTVLPTAQPTGAPPLEMPPTTRTSFGSVGAPEVNPENVLPLAADTHATAGLANPEATRVPYEPVIEQNTTPQSQTEQFSAVDRRLLVKQGLKPEQIQALWEKLHPTEDTNLGTGAINLTGPNVVPDEAVPPGRDYRGQSEQDLRNASNQDNWSTGRASQITLPTETGLQVPDEESWFANKPSEMGTQADYLESQTHVPHLDVEGSGNVDAGNFPPGPAAGELGKFGTSLLDAEGNPAKVDVSNLRPSKSRGLMSKTPGYTVADLESVGLNPNIRYQKIPQHLMDRIETNRANRAIAHPTNAAINKAYTDALSQDQP